MDQLAELLFKHHPDFASWLLSNKYTKNVTPGQLRSAFPTLRMHRTGDAILDAFKRAPTGLRSVASKSAGFASGSDLARLAAPSRGGGIAALRALGPVGAAATAASMVGPEIYNILKEDSDAKRMVEDMDRKREINRMLDRELRRPLPSERMSEDRQRMLREMEAGRAGGRRIRINRPEDPIFLRPIDLDISLEDALGPSSQNIIEDDLARLLPQILPRTVELERNFIPKRQITVPPVSTLRGRR